MTEAGQVLFGEGPVHIAEIGVALGRDVVYIIFPECIENGLPVEACSAREDLIALLGQAGIRWASCRLFAVGQRAEDDCGSIFVDVPNAERDPRYRTVACWFDSISGVRRIEGCELCFLSLEAAKLQVASMERRASSC